MGPTCSAGAINPVIGDAPRRLRPHHQRQRAHRREHDLRLRRQRQGRLRHAGRPDADLRARHDGFPALRDDARRGPGPVRTPSAASATCARRRRPGGVVVTRTFDFAGRLTEEDAGGLKYLVNCYDGKATCVDGSAGFGGGAYPAGKLTRRYGLQPDPDDRARRRRAVRVRGRRRAASRSSSRAPATAVSRSRRARRSDYGNLGVVTNHGHPRSTGLFPVVSTYTNGLPTASERQRRDRRHRRGLQPRRRPRVVDGRHVRRARRHEHRPGRDDAPAPRQHLELALVDRDLRLRRRRQRPQDGDGRHVHVRLPLAPRLGQVRIEPAQLRLRPLRQPDPERRHDHDRPGPQPGDQRVGVLRRAAAT